MTRVIYSDPSEGDEWSGYHSFDVEEQGELVANVNLVEGQMLDLSDPEELAELGEVIQRTAENLQGMDL